MNYNFYLSECNSDTKTLVCVSASSYLPEKGGIKPVGNGEGETEMLMSHHHLVLHIRVQILNSYVFLHTLFLYVGLLACQLVQ